MAALRLGEVLVDSKLLTTEQVASILQRQQQTGQPFGMLAEAMFGIHPDRIEDAWAQQYASLTRRIDPATEVYEQRAAELITRRQAWQFRVLPIRFDGRELMIATTADHLRRALRFATRVLGVQTYFVIASSRDLGEALCKRYPLPGMTPGSVEDEALERLLALS
jgi:hypothetical protein